MIRLIKNLDQTFPHLRFMTSVVDTAPVLFLPVFFFLGFVEAPAIP